MGPVGAYDGMDFFWCLALWGLARWRTSVVFLSFLRWSRALASYLGDLRGC